MLNITILELTNFRERKLKTKKMIQTLTVYRNWKSAYNQQTILKDCNNKVKAIFNSSLKQPKRGTKTIIINCCKYKLDWWGVE